MGLCFFPVHSLYMKFEEMSHLIRVGALSLARSSPIFYPYFNFDLNSHCN